MGLVAEGVDAIREAMGAIEVTPEKMEFVVHNTAENPETNVVMNERTERVKTDKGWSETRVMSVFRIENGKVQEWRDYFDMAEMQKALE
jgi:limonene-1,2-epoxide hydrolase